MIVRVDKYTNETGKLIEECIIIDNENEKPIDRFLGTAMIQTDTPFGPQQQPFKFKIKANDLKEAFAKFSEYARKTANEIEEKEQQAAQARQNKIQIAGPGQVPKLPPGKGKLIL